MLQFVAKTENFPRGRRININKKGGKYEHMEADAIKTMQSH